MTITIPSFLYALVICLIFYILRGNSRKYLLAVASIFYVYALSSHAGIAVMAVSVLAYLFGCIIGQKKTQGNEKAAAAYTYAAVALCVLSLLILKYLPRADLFSTLFIPVGYSFYIFQVISYLVDIKRGTIQAQKNPVDVLLYLTWFPKFVSGPIERFDGFHKEIEQLSCVRFRDFDRWKRAIYYILFGCFMKIVIADRLAVPVDKLFEGVMSYGSLWLILGSIFYTVQIYCDFAGYSYVAIGVSLMFGIELMKNFEMPYCSKNITEFWRRWHMSLSSFLKDYLYIPLGGNRKGDVRKIINTMIVFLVCGMWHGSGFNFVAWGLLHGAFSAVDSICKQKGIALCRKGILGLVIAFCEASFAWIFFRATSFSSALGYVKGIFTHLSGYGSFTYQMERLEMALPELILIGILFVAMAILDSLAYRHKNCIPEMISVLPQGVRYVCFYVLVIVIFIFGAYGPDMGARLIYMNF